MVTVAIKYVSDHPAVPHRGRVLASDEPHHSFRNVLRRARPTSPVLGSIESLALKGEVDFFEGGPRRRKLQVDASEFLGGQRVVLRRLAINPNRQPDVVFRLLQVTLESAGNRNF